MDKALSDRFREIRDLLGLSQSDFAHRLNTHPRNISKYETAQTGIPDEVKQQLGDMDVNLHWLLTGDGARFLSDAASQIGQSGQFEASASSGEHLHIVHPSELTGSDFLVPVLDQAVSAGSGAELGEADQARALIPAPPYLSRFGKSIAALPVRGDSMEPTLRNGDLVVCDTLGWQDEGIYVVQLNAQSFVKRVTIRLKNFIILSDNRAYPPVEEPLESEGLRIVGKVRCALRAM